MHSLAIVNKITISIFVECEENYMVWAMKVVGKAGGNLKWRMKKYVWNKKFH